MTNDTESRLFTPLSLGRITLSHRVVMAPLTRYRCDSSNIPLDMVTEYYTQRASTPGTLLIAEATQISLSAGGMTNGPGIWNDAQIAAWKKVTDAVHDKGSYIFCQLIALGRAARPAAPEANGGFEVRAPSAIPLDGSQVAIPKELEEEEIWKIIADFGQAAKNAIEAGFDGVEAHGANGYLIDQFLQDVTNRRTDGWGGSIENRSRFSIEVTKSMVNAVGADRVAFRLSPWNTWQGMGMEQPVPQFSHLIQELQKMDLAYLHLVESRVINNVDKEKEEGLDPFLEAWGTEKPVILAGGYNAHNTKEAVEVEYSKYNVAIAFGRHFLANPDLPLRLKERLDLNGYDRSTFYTPMLEAGYLDYPFSKQSVPFHRSFSNEKQDMGRL